MYGNYIIKFSFFSYINFLARQFFDNVDIFDNVKIKFIMVCLHYVVCLGIMFQPRFIFVQQSDKFFEKS